MPDNYYSAPILTLHHDPHGVPGGLALAGDPGAGVGPGVFPLEAGEDELLPGQTERAVRQGPALPPPGEAGGRLSCWQADQAQLRACRLHELTALRFPQDRHSRRL